MQRCVRAVAHASDRPRRAEGSRVSEVMGGLVIGGSTFDGRAESSRGKVTAWVRQNWEFGLVLSLLLLVYQPWNSRLLPVTDFGTFLVERGPSSSLPVQLANLIHYYAADGRLCIFPYLTFIVGAKVFGVWAPGWYWMYFALNCVVLVFARSFFIRTGAGRIPSLIAVALFATMGPTAEAWIRPTGEPFAIIFMLIAMKFAVNFTCAPDWRRRAVLIALCAVGIIYSKEVLVVLVPIIWLFSRLRISENRWSWAGWTRRDTYLILLLTVTTIAALIPVAYVALSAPKDNYASLYGHVSHPLYWTLNRLETVLIPAQPRLHRLINLIVDPGWTLLFVLPNLLWLRLVVGGIVSGRSRLAWPLATSGIWILMGLVIYLPWPIADDFYMMPFALAAMFGSAHALNAMIGDNRMRLSAVIAASGILLAASSVEGRTVVYHRQLRAKLYGQVMDNLTRKGSVPVLIGATPEPAPLRRSWATNIKGFALVTRGLQISDAKDLSCADAKLELQRRPGIVVVSTAWGCGKLAPNSTELRAVVPRYQWPWLWERHEVEARMFVTESGQASATDLSGSRSADGV